VHPIGSYRTDIKKLSMTVHCSLVAQQLILVRGGSNLQV